MRIIVHRGTHEIGGSCIEVISGNTRVILDAGLPLDANPERPATLNVPGLFDGNGKGIHGLFLSHAHADHAGLIAATCARVPVWVTTGTSKMLFAGGLFARQNDVPRSRQRKLTPSVPVQVGSVTITALSVDHSVYDAVAFLVEADGTRLLYTGDLRFHGRKPGMIRELVRVCRQAPLDALVIEGTRLGARSREANLSEIELEAAIRADISSSEGVVLAMYSPMNVDRFVTLYRAAKASGRIFVVDPYQAFVLHLIAKQVRVPLPSERAKVRVIIPPQYHARLGRRLMRSTWVQQLPTAAIKTEEIRTEPAKYVMLFRESMIPWLYPSGLPSGATCIFSYWPGYLRDRRLQALQAGIRDRTGRFLLRHASGHAHPDDLSSFARRLNPHLLIPVHTIQPEAWIGLWPRTCVASDGETIPISK